MEGCAEDGKEELESAEGDLGNSNRMPRESHDFFFVMIVSFFGKTRGEVVRRYGLALSDGGGTGRNACDREQ